MNYIVQLVRENGVRFDDVNFGSGCCVGIDKIPATHINYGNVEIASIFVTDDAELDREAHIGFYVDGVFFVDFLNGFVGNGAEIVSIVATLDKRTDLSKIGFFKRETSAMMIERASWNDDESADCLKDISIDVFWRDYIDEMGVIYETLDHDPEFVFGHYSVFEKAFNEVRDTLWYSGTISEVYDANEAKELDECYDFLSETTTEWCPECECEVELEMTLKMQVCPSCGKPIAPCSICKECNCSHCPLGCK